MGTRSYPQVLHGDQVISSGTAWGPGHILRYCMGTSHTYVCMYTGMGTVCTVQRGVAVMYKGRGSIVQRGVAVNIQVQH